MSGLLDFLNSTEPGQAEGRMAMAQGLLNGPGSSISRMAGGMQAYNVALALAKREEDMRKAREQELQMRAMQMEEAKRAQEAAALAAQQRAKDQGLMQRLIGMPVEQDMPQGQMGPGAPQRNSGIDPRAFLNQGGSFEGLPSALALSQALQPPKPAAPIVSKPGDIARDPVTGQMIWQNPDAPKEQAPTILAKLIAERDSLPPGHPNRRLYDAEIAKQTTHAPGTNVSINTAKPMLNSVAEGLGKQIDSSLSNAKAAVSSINTAQTIRSAVDSGKIVSGPGASFRVLGLQIGQMLGVGGKDGAEILGNTRTAIQSLAQAELDAAQQMKGQGQITEAERSIIRRAAAGNIDDMTAPELRILSNVMEKTARFKISQHKQNLRGLQQMPGAEPLLPFYQIDEPPQYSAPGQGVRRYNPATGRIE